MIKLLIISDDFTGALDTGVQLSAGGAATYVTLDSEFNMSDFAQDIDVLVINTETRHSDQEQAYKKVFSITKRALNAGIPYIFGAIQGWVAQAAVSMPEDNLLEILYPEGTVIRDKSVLSFTPALCASMQVSLCVKLLTGRSVETGTVYHFDLLNQEFEAIPLV